MQELKHYPKRIKKPSSDAEKQGNRLARYIRKNWDKLAPRAIETLEIVQGIAKEEVAAQKKSEQQLVAQELLAEAVDFGRSPQERRQSQDAELEKERLLAQTIRKSNFEKVLTSTELKKFKALPTKCRVLATTPTETRGATVAHLATKRPAPPVKDNAMASSSKAARTTATATQRCQSKSTVAQHDVPALPDSAAEKQEDSLAKSICKHWNELNSSTS